MADDNEPEQIKIMREMRDLAVRQTELARERTTMAAEQSAMSADRSRMSAERSEMSAERSYHNVERTLSVWVRTALALMVFGIAIDRFSLFLSEKTPSALMYSRDLSTMTGAGLVAFGVVVALGSGIRYLRYVAKWRQHHTFPYRHGLWLAPFFAFTAAVFGLVLLILMLQLVG